MLASGKTIHCQSDAEGEVALPSPFVSPPALSSRIEVKMMLWLAPERPMALSEPFTVSEREGSNFTTTPGWM